MIQKEPEPDSLKLAREALAIERQIMAAREVIRQQRKIIARLRVELEGKQRESGCEFP